MAIHNEEVFGVPMNAVVIYEECDNARMANALLKRASERADAATQWSVKPWRLDLLNWPPLAQEALRDADEAHLLLLALGGKRELPADLLYWLETWAARRQVADAALAVFDGSDRDTFSGGVTPGLSEFAERHGLSMIFGDIAPEEDEPATLREDLHEREAARTPTLAHILEQARPGNYCQWGINE